MGKACPRPIRSSLVEGSDPAAIARALLDVLGRDTLYIADLDAIAGAEPAWAIYERLADQGARLRIDAGLDATARLEALLAWGQCSGALEGIVVGLESLPALDQLTPWFELAGAERLVFSLDLKEGVPLCREPALKRRSGDEIALAAIALGVRRLIVLDLARVGTGGVAGTEALCRALRDVHPDLELTAGGGVRGVADLRALVQAGCDAALVASALHDGRLTRDDLVAWH